MPKDISSPLSIGRIKGWCVVFFIFIQFLIELYVNNKDPVQTPRFAVSDRGLQCLPMFHRKNVSLILYMD